jgi:hypothetical protein
MKQNVNSEGICNESNGIGKRAADGKAVNIVDHEPC